jgi:hypothetical protein
MRNQSLARWVLIGMLLALWGCSHSASNTPASSTSSNGAPRGTNSAGSSPPAPTPPPAPVPAPPIAIPAGTTLTVTLNQGISTKTNSSGDSFAASLAEPATIDGNTVLLTGTRAHGIVVQAQAAGHLKGGAVQALTLDSITINGQKYSIEPKEFEESGEGRGKQTAIGGGGGAAFGAIVGALAGGGKGAAIGALAGGGAGTTGTAFTGKRDISLPAETRLH